MSKNLRRLTLLLAAVCVMIVMAVPAFANAGVGYYQVGTPTLYNATDEITVKLSIQSRTYSNTDLSIINTLADVTLTGKTSYTVRDVLIAYNSMSTGIQFKNNTGQSLTTTDTTVKSIQSGSKNYQYKLFADLGVGYGREPVDGWMFRVNGQYPLKSLTGYYGGPEGAYIHEVPIKNGDVVSFYFNCPFVINNSDYSTGFVSADSSYNSSTNTLTVNLKTCHENHCNTNPNYYKQWTFDVQNCTYFTDTPVGTLYDSNLNSIGTITFSTTNGQGTLNQTLSSGTYYLYVPVTQDWTLLSGYSSFSGNSKTSYYGLSSTFVFDRIDV